MSSAKYNTFNFFKGIAEFFTPVLEKSEFQERGVITPKEFVFAGDMIVSKCPTWSWATGDPKKVVDWLPKEKQFLITKKVPCLQRAKSLEVAGDERDVEGDWTETHVSYTSIVVPFPSSIFF